ncbi:hypothetical protein MMC18_008588 [Xylographa bjoerkii]|nr:hypothetical protein [Xylographa bjoerkii]
MEILYSFDYYTESWIEVSSQPSSSSLSSTTADDGVAPSPREQHGVNARRRRHLHRSINLHLQNNLPARPRSATGSSQEEYEESESESDPIMSSSNEDLHPHFTQDESPPPAASSVSETAPSDEDDDGNSTALGINTTEPVFTPQPNVFSHPPVSQSSRQASVPGSYFPYQAASARSTAQRHSYPQRARSHTPYNMISPSYQADHDAALRASLSTLLSCAAAARGLAKREPSNRAQPTATAGSSNRIEPSSLRLVPESALLATSLQPTSLPFPRRSSISSSSAPSLQGKGKRKSSSRDRRDTKKKRRGASTEEMLISPTLMTWVVSAGVVVLFSAISFSAGFAYGKEVGRLEMAGNGGGGCAREVTKGYSGSLRRLRWGNASVVRV